MQHPRQHPTSTQLAALSLALMGSVALAGCLDTPYAESSQQESPEPDEGMSPPEMVDDQQDPDEMEGPSPPDASPDPTPAPEEDVEEDVEPEPEPDMEEE